MEFHTLFEVGSRQLGALLWKLLVVGSFSEALSAKKRVRCVPVMRTCAAVLQKRPNGAKLPLIATWMQFLSQDLTKIADSTF